jgi:hypothetical protein
MQGDELQQDMAEQLLQAGMAYGLGRLVALCEAQLARCISIDTAVDILLLAEGCRAQVRLVIKWDLWLAAAFEMQCGRLALTVPVQLLVGCPTICRLQKLLEH